MSSVCSVGHPLISCLAWAKSSAEPPRLTPVHVTVRELFSKFARGVSALAGHPAAFAAALFGVLTWAALGPRLHYSENWQLWINTATTILTFLMVFLLQHSQNRDARAVQLKLDELLRAVTGARNEFIDLENLSEEELAKYCREFQELHLRYARAIEQKDRRRTREARGEPSALAPASLPRPPLKVRP